MPRFTMRDFCGVVPALLTPFKADGALDLPALRKITRHLIDRGVHGLYLTGSTGEGFMMSPEERKLVVETVVDETKGAIPLVVHVGAISTQISIDLARHAEAVGADGISSVPPIYWQFSADQVFEYYKEITESTSLPMIVYNVPLAAMGFPLLKRLATIEGVVGVKYTATTHCDIMRLKEEIGQDFLIYSGADEMAMSGLAFGADGIIGSFYNIIPELYLELFAAMKADNLPEARRLQRLANAVIFETLKVDAMAALKEQMGWAGAHAGYPRKPHSHMSAEGIEDLKARFRALGQQYDLSGLEMMKGL